MAFKRIPDTTFETYISGLHSLNMDLRDGTGSGWHFSNFWLGGKAPIKLYGKGTKVNTNSIFGYYGVADRSRQLKRLGADTRKVYVANHYRAVLDLSYEYIRKYENVGEIYGAVDHFFPDENQREELFNFLLILRENLHGKEVSILDDWLYQDFRPIYKRWRSGRLQSPKALSYYKGTGHH